MPKTHSNRDKLSEVVLEAMHDGMSLRKACIEAGISAATFVRWCDESESLAKQYVCAREACIDKIADEIIEISDEAVPTTSQGSLDSAAVAQNRLRVDSRKWLLSKLAPKKYGDKIETVHSGTGPGGAIVVNAIINGVKVGNKSSA